jgi:dTDP-4-amino-4,6-dideoxygalactose transaminase
MTITFNKPYMTGKELKYISEAHAKRHLSGDGPFSKKCSEWLEKSTGCNKALLTHSCTAALEIAAILADVQPGDEIIMPSYTFSSTATSFVLRGGVPVFVDTRMDTLNIDENRIEKAITEKTKAIVPMHYAGVACEMDTINAIAKQHNLLVIEDAAQGVMSTYKNKPLGNLGHMAAISFHETKNIISGEGGALLINEERFIERAEIIREKGTNRSKFFRGEIDKYTWVDIGSSYLPGELIAAFLWAQMEEAESINQRRLKIWNSYNEAFEELEKKGKIRRPVVPSDCEHNAHMYYLLLPDLKARTDFLEKLKGEGIYAIFHYIPLHSSPAGRKYGRAYGKLSNTLDASDRIVRLPLWIEMEEKDISRVIEAVFNSLQ